jgi:hypothetical protein
MGFFQVVDTLQESKNNNFGFVTLTKRTKIDFCSFAWQSQSYKIMLILLYINDKPEPALLPLVYNRIKYHQSLQHIKAKKKKTHKWLRKISTRKMSKPTF